MPTLNETMQLVDAYAAAARTGETPPQMEARRRKVHESIELLRLGSGLHGALTTREALLDHWGMRLLPDDCEAAFQEFHARYKSEAGQAVSINEALSRLLRFALEHENLIEALFEEEE